jgi:DUF4097 and DUF4098 domain-containing protein YvlB
MAAWEFACSEPIDANISLASGSVTITAAPTDAITVRIGRGRSGDQGTAADDDQLADEVTVEFAERHLVVSQQSGRSFRWHSKDLHIVIAMPAGSRVAVRAASADIALRGEYGAVDVGTASGSIDVATVHGPVEISTMSGATRVDAATGASLQSASGQIALRHAAADVNARSASGNIQIGTADASVTARTASGQVRIASVTRGRADLNSVSGNIEVKVAQGTGVFLDLSSVTGRVTSDLAASGQDGDADLRLHCRTVSGSVHVARAASAEMAS